MNSVKYVTVKKSQKANKNQWITAFTLQRIRFLNYSGGSRGKVPGVRASLMLRPN